MARWISSKKRNGQARTYETIALFAINNAFAERLPFTCLDFLGVKGRTVTYNYEK